MSDRCARRHPDVRASSAHARSALPSASSLRSDSQRPEASAMPTSEGRAWFTWRLPTKCPHCKEPVFFFSCDCGSKVFFDDLGDPWPIHDCDTSWTRSLNRMRGGDGTITVQLADGVTIRRPT